MEFNHYSVMLHETIEELHIQPDGIYVDGTLGAVDMHMRSAAAYRIGVIFTELTRMQRQFRQQGNGFLVSGRKCLLSEAITARWCRS